MIFMRLHITFCMMAQFGHSISFPSNLALKINQFLQERSGDYFSVKCFKPRQQMKDNMLCGITSF